jgi:hypothetical protein
VVCVLGVGLAVGSWGQRVQVQFMHHFSPELNTGTQERNTKHIYTKTRLIAWRDWGWIAFPGAD